MHVKRERSYLPPRRSDRQGKRDTLPIIGLNPLRNFGYDVFRAEDQVIGEFRRRVWPPRYRLLLKILTAISTVFSAST